ncbi:hypothetical protein IscW_ISCW019060 [Ixodes scapularis]|uniref:Uncharacterized protein n=1 Tax=Ixodes scapularis TaxID=6945 RepID=B7PP30_IXOSC|nr:hypothetical protein IscW_ISCW019060 [Ixodes scapularis]|eukprot:XP_002435522.1 hypothetical protein IscW_ISCW019060 [Ixodes scapularis]
MTQRGPEARQGPGVGGGGGGGRRPGKRLRARAAQLARETLARQLLQGLVARSLLKGARSRSLASHVPLPWLALLVISR